MSHSFANPWTVAHNVSLSIEFSRQEHRSELPFPSPEDLPNYRDQTHISYTGRQTSYCWATREALPKTRASQQESLRFISTWHTQITAFSHSGKAAVPLNLETAFHKNSLLIHFNFKIDTWSCSLKKRAPSTHIAMFGILKASLTINSKLIVSQQP